MLTTSQKRFFVSLDEFMEPHIKWSMIAWAPLGGRQNGHLPPPGNWE